MASLIRTNLLSNERLDLPDFNNIENFVIEDFNAIMKFLMTGSSSIVTGFRLFQDSATLVDNPTASPVYIKLAGSSVLHTEETSGTPMYYVGASTLPAVAVDLVPNATNYIEMELTITTNAADTRAFWDPSANNGEGAEFTQIVDTARNLTAIFTVNNIGFSGGNKVPIAQVVMTGSVITSNKDRRNRFFALQKGQPEDSSYEYPWTQGRAQPNSDRTVDANAYIGADKSISTFKEWMDAIMTEIKLMKGGAYWFSPGSSLVPGVNSSDLFFDTKGSVLTGTGRFLHSDTTPGMLTWTSDLYIKSLYGKLALEIEAGSVTLADEQVAYVQLIRNQNFQPANQLTFTNGSLTVTGALAVTGIAAGDWIKAESASLSAWTQVQSVAGNTITLVSLYPGATITENGVRTQGTYSTVTAANPTAVPMNGDVYVLGKRVDNGGSTARIYLGGAGGGEIEAGEEEDIGDDDSLDIYTFIGSTGKTDDTPNYLYLPGGLSPYSFSQGDNLVRAISICVANINAILLTLDSPSYDENYEVVAGGGAAVVASLLTDNNQGNVIGNNGSYIEGFGQTFKPTANGELVKITVPIRRDGAPTGTFTMDLYLNPSSPTVGSPIASSTTVIDSATLSTSFVDVDFLFPAGTILNTANTYLFVYNVDNMTFANFFTDVVRQKSNTLAAYADGQTWIQTSDFPSQAYTANGGGTDYLFSVTANAGAVTDNQILGPIAANTVITIPKNSREADAQQFYTVGKGALDVFLNGQRLIQDIDWQEVGVTGAASSEIELLQAMELTDNLTFAIKVLGGPGSGGAGGGAPDDDFVTLPTENTASPSDYVLIYDVSSAGYKKQLRSVFLAGLTNDYNTTTKTADYTALISDNVINVNSTGGLVTITLPAASSTPGHVFLIKKIAGGANNINVVAASGNIEGTADLLTFVGGPIADGDAFTIISDGTNYWLY